MSFEKWFAQVNFLILCKDSFVCPELSDDLYRDWYNDGLSPDEAVDMAFSKAADSYCDWIDGYINRLTD